mgnify:CR=1 FL=1
MFGGFVLKNKQDKKSQYADLITADGGFIWSNENFQEQEAYKLILGEIITALKIQKRKPVYCLPGKLVINGKNLIRFLDDEIKELKEQGKFTGKEPIGMLLILHLEKVFPCDD